MNFVTRIITTSVISASILVSGLAACTKNDTAEHKMSQSVMTNVRPWCIGRFTFDRPQDSTVFDDMDFRYMGYSISKQESVSSDAFRRRVDSREHELRAALRTDMSNMPAKTKHAWLQQKVQPSANSALFIYRDSDSSSVGLSYDVEGYALSDNILFILKNSFGPAYDQEPVQIGSEILRNIKPRGDWDLPRDDGFCFNGGVIGGRPYESFEARQTIMLVQGRPSLFVVDMRDSVAADQKTSLLKDLPAMEAQMKATSSGGGDFRILKKGMRHLAGIPAEEVLFSIHENGVQKFAFYLLASGVDGDISKPHTALQLTFGADPDAEHPAITTTSPVDEQQAVSTWDALLNSFRYRSVAK